MIGKAQQIVFIVLIFGFGATAQSLKPLTCSEIIKTAQQVTLEKYPNANEVLLDSWLRVEYQADGCYEQWDEAYVKILTEEARRGHQTLRSYFTIPYQRGPEDCRIDLVEIIKPDGSRQEIDIEAQSKLTINTGSMSQNIYNPNDKVISVGIAGLEVGDILRYQLYDRVVQPRMTNTWSHWISFERNNPILRKTVEVHAPLNQPLQSMALKAPVENTVSYTCVTNEHSISYVWQAADVPRMYIEPNMPPAHTVLQRQLISTVPDWETISRWYWDLSEPHLETTPEIQAKVTELVAGITNRPEQIYKIFQFVSQQIRYMGITIEATAPGYEPHDVAETFAARHGVCRDKAALLVAMLRDAGHEAFPTLIHAGAKKDPEVPQPYFNHAIVAVRNEDGTYQLMDPTDENARQMLPAYLCDKSYLVATPEGDTLRTSAIVSANENLMRISTTGTLSQSGELTATLVLQFDGINDNAYRGHLANKQPEERERLFKNRVKRVAPGATVSDIIILPEDLTDTTTPLSVQLTFRAKNILVQGENSTLMPLPWLGTSMGMANFIIGQTGLQERKYPFKTDIACGIQEEIVLDCSTNVTIIELPTYEKKQQDAINWDISCKQQTNQLVATSLFSLNQTEYTPEEYLGLKEILKQSEKDLLKGVILQQATSAASTPDSELIDVKVDYQLADAHTWTTTSFVKRKIRTYAGKKKHSELKISYNPIWEQAELDYAHVTNPDGTQKEIRPEEINIMDAFWAGAAPRYPASKTLVASFPAVEIGSIIEYQTTRTFSNHPFFYAQQSFRLKSPIQQKTVTLDAPDDLALTIATNDPTGMIIETGPTTWSIANTSPVKPEPNLPPWHIFNPTLFISAGDWQPYIQEVHQHLLEASENQPLAIAKAKELVEGISDPKEQVIALRDFMAIHIRDAGPHFTALPYASITSADQTLIDGYGHDADRGILFYTLLSAAGFKPAFVLASWTSSLSQLIDPFKKVPRYQFFPVVLIRLHEPFADDPPGADYYLNTGSQYGELGTCAFEGNAGLALSSGQWITIKPVKPLRSKQAISMVLQPSGAASITIQKEYFGMSYEHHKQFFAELPPEERRRYYQELVAEVAQSATPVGELHTDFSNYPGAVSFSVEVPDYATVTSNHMYFPLPAEADDFFYASDDKRDHPLCETYRQNASLHLDITIPPAYQIESAPDTITRNQIAGAPITLTQQTTQNGNNFHLNVLVTQQPFILPSSDYPELVQLNTMLSSPQQNMVLLVKKRIPDPEPSIQ